MASVDCSSARWQSAGCAWQVEAMLTTLPLDLIAAMAAVTHDTCGAVATFVGTTRGLDAPTGRRVLRLEYEAHTSLALAQALRLGRAVAEGAGQCGNSANDPPAAAPLGRIYVAHRIGSVGVGEASIVVAVATPHRAHALSAVAWIMDRIKESLPVWKREVLAEEDGEGGSAGGATAVWKENSECPWRKPEGSANGATGVGV